MKTLCLTMMVLPCILLAEDLKTITGETYRDVVVKGHDAVGINIAHADGVARVEFRNLPSDVAKAYGYDPAAAAAQKQAEAQIAAQRIQQVQSSIAAQRQALEREALRKDAVTIKTRVRQVVSEGLLLEDGTLLRGHPGQSSLADGDRIEAAAIPDGAYQYVTVMGSTKTVHALRYVGEPLPAPVPAVSKSGLRGTMLDEPAKSTRKHTPGLYGGAARN